MTAREGLDRLLASKPGIDVAMIDGQPEQPVKMHDCRTGEVSELYRTSSGPWVCVDFVDGEQFAIWKRTGAVFRLDEHGAVEDDPIDFETEAERIDPAEHIDPDDPRYDGFRVREYWMATAVAPDNQEAPVYVDPMMAQKFHLAVGPAMAADERRARHLRELAAWVAQEYETEIHVRHFMPKGDPEIYSPPVR